MCGVARDAGAADDLAAHMHRAAPHAVVLRARFPGA